MLNLFEIIGQKTVKRKVKSVWNYGSENCKQEVEYTLHL